MGLCDVKLSECARRGKLTLLRVCEFFFFKLTGSLKIKSSPAGHNNTFSQGQRSEFWPYHRKLLDQKYVNKSAFNKGGFEEKIYKTGIEIITN